MYSLKSSLKHYEGNIPFSFPQKSRSVNLIDPSNLKIALMDILLIRLISNAILNAAFSVTFETCRRATSKQM